MKLATLRDGSRDGRLVVVSRDLTRCTEARRIAPTLQAALDDWEHCGPELAAMARDLEIGAEPVERFHEREALSPLPRPLTLCGARSGGLSAAILAPRAPIPAPPDDAALACSAGVAVIAADAAMGATREDAAQAIVLVALVNRIAAAEPGSGTRMLAFSPVAVTPDELGAAWRDGALQGELHVDVNGAPLGRWESGGADAPDFAALLARLAATRPVGAGAVLLADRAASPAALPAGDMLRVEMQGSDGHSLFGAIEQRAEAPAS